MLSCQDLLYGCPLWALNSPSLKVIETALNKLLRKVWNLPYIQLSHGYCAFCNTVSNLILKRFCSLYNRALSSSSYLVYSESSKLLHSFSGYNHIYGHYNEFISSNDLYIAYFNSLGIFTVYFLLVKT